MSGVICPVACGSCCDLYWFEVMEDNMGDECPHLTSKGCALPRDKRPKGCVEYMCDLGKCADLMEQAEVKSILDNSAQVCPDIWDVHTLKKCEPRMYGLEET